MEETKNINSSVSEYDRIGGWLGLVALGLVLSFIRLISQILGVFSTFSSEAWPLLTTPGTEMYNSLCKPLMLFEAIANPILLLYVVILLILFFQRKGSLPKAIIGMYIFNFLFTITDYYLFNLIFPTASLDNSYSIHPLVKSFVLCIIWIPYFIKSKRVKCTFVN